MTRTSTNYDNHEVSPSLTARLHQLADNWGWYLALGIALILTGIVAITFPWITTVVSVVYFGSLLIVGGGIEIIRAFRMSKWGSFLLHLLLGILYFVAGFVILVHPQINALSLTLLLAAFFIAAGLFRIVSALTVPVPQWGWVLFNGIVTVILGFLIWRQWPISGLWAIGLFVGVEMIVSGWVSVLLAVQARRLKNRLAID